MAEQVQQDGWRPKLVALDIDGTVVDHAGRLPDPVRDAVQRVLAAGVPVPILFGTESGNAELVAEELGTLLGECEDLVVADTVRSARPTSTRPGST